MYKSNRDHLQAVADQQAEPGTESLSLSRDVDSITIGQLSSDAGVTLRALRFYQSKGLLAPQRNGVSRIFNRKDRARLGLIQQGKRLGFTLCEIRQMLVGRRGQPAGACDAKLAISRKKCVEQIKLLEHQRRDLELALAELRQIYTAMSMTVEIPRIAAEPAAKIA